MQREAPETAAPPPDVTHHEPAISKPRAKRLYLIIGAAALLLLIGYGIYALVTSGKETTDDAQIAADVVPVAPRVGGQVSSLNITENQFVHKGDRIAEIDPRDLEAKAAQAQGDFDTAQAQALQADAQVQIASAAARGGLQSAQAGVAGARENVSASADAVAAARAGVARAEANANRARLDYQRAEELGAKGDIPKSQVDAARAATETANADVTSARANLQAAIAAQSRMQSSVQQAQGQLQQSSQVPAQIAAAQANAALAHAKAKASQAALATAQLNLSYTKIYAPIDGFAAKLGVHAGQIVSQGQPICQLVPTRTYILANFKETQVKNMRPGQPATVRVDALGGRNVDGKVESISGGTGSTFALLPADNASGNFVKVVQRIPVRIAWNGPPSSQAPVGSSAEVTVRTK